MKSAMGNKLVYGIVTTIVSILVIVVLSIWQYQRIRDSGAIVRHANLVMYQTQAVLTTAMQYELNSKNFLLTHDSAFLDSASHSLSVLPVAIDSLKRLTADNPDQQRLLDSLGPYMNMHGLTLEGAVLTSPKDRAAASAVLIGVLTRLADEEHRFAETRRNANQVKATRLQWVLWALSVAVCVLAYMTFRIIRKDLRKEKESREQLHQFNEQLADEVKRQTALLRSSEDKYKTLFYKSPLAKWIYDEQTLRFLEVNDAALQMYGYTRDEFQQMTLAEIRPPSDVPKLMDDITLVRRDPAASLASQWRHLKKNGEMMDVQVSAHFIEYEGKKARVVAITDVTERIRNESQLNKLNADLGRRAGELAASNAELERFAYIASHDLQEPLRMVSSFLQLLQKKYKGQLDEKADQYIHYAVDGAERMKALIMDLLEYSRAGNAKETFGQAEMETILKEVGDIFGEKIAVARASVEVGPLPVVWGDKVQLLQLFQNLLSNALKYHTADRPPVIRIHAKEEPGCWLFSVEDNGIGIDPQFFDKIFIIFQRLHNKTDYSGTGIGLAICKKIVERHGGKIWVESSPDQGSKFYFTIGKKV
jgi:PAS domain S-box-containing protein